GSIVSELGTKVDPDRDAIKVDGKRVGVAPRVPTYLAFHKPRGVVTTLSDPEGRPTVRDFLGGVTVRVYPVGRLDFDSEGLLLLTDDGTLARDLMHPSSGVEKTYRAKVRGVPEPRTLDRLARGSHTDGRGAHPARPALARYAPGGAEDRPRPRAGGHPGGQPLARDRDRRGAEPPGPPD